MSLSLIPPCLVSLPLQNKFKPKAGYYACKEKVNTKLYFTYVLQIVPDIVYY